VFAGWGMGPRRCPLPGGRATRPTAAPPLCKAPFCRRVAYVSGARCVSTEGAGRGACGQGHPGSYWGGAGERARGGPGICRHGRGRHCALGEGGFRSRRGYYWGRIVCPLVRCAAPLTLWMPILPTHTSGVDLSVAGGLVDGPGPAGGLTACPRRDLDFDQGVLCTPLSFRSRCLGPTRKGGLPLYKESQAAHPSHEPNAQPPISSLCTAVMASLPIMQYPYTTRMVVCHPPQTPTRSARHGLYSPLSRLLPCVAAPALHLARPGRGGSGMPGVSPWPEGR